MKKYIALVLALLLALSLFAGCNNGSTPSGGDATAAPATQAPATKAPATQAPDNGGESSGDGTPAPAEEDEGPYHLAAGKYEKDVRAGL